MKPVISSIFISKAVERGRKRHKIVAQTHLYLLEFSFYLLFPTIFHTGKSHASRNFWPFHDTTRLITLSSLMQRCFLWSIFYIQLVSHRTQMVSVGGTERERTWHEMAPISLNCDANSSKSHHIYMLFNSKLIIFLLWIIDDVHDMETHVQSTIMSQIV